ncbi:MAG TPA: glycosyltransferase, partial [Roseateles sp.]
AVGGNVELVDDGATGRLLPTRDGTALAAALQEMLEQPERRLAWGRAARQAALDRFSMDGMLAAYASVYDGLEQHK